MIQELISPFFANLSILSLIIREQRPKYDKQLSQSMSNMQITVWIWLTDKLFNKFIWIVNTIKINVMKNINEYRLYQICHS